MLHAAAALIRRVGAAFSRLDARLARTAARNAAKQLTGWPVVAATTNDHVPALHVTRTLRDLRRYREVTA
jgi:hypothetical protein